MRIDSDETARTDGRACRGNVPTSRAYGWTAGRRADGPSHPATAPPGDRSDGRMINLTHAGGGRSGGQDQWTQSNVFTNQPTVRRHRSKGGRAQTAPHAGKKRHHHSAHSGGIATVRTTMRLALAARDRELRVERARSDTRAEVVELWVARSTAVVQQELRTEFQGSLEHE